MSWQDGTAAVAMPQRELTFERPLAVLLAALSAGAAAIHFAVVNEHLHEYVPFGLFFIGSGAAQAVWAAMLLGRPTRRLYVLGMVGNLAIVALWLVSRTKGLPIGPEPWQPEPVAVLDVVCSAYEIALSAGLAAILFLAGGRASAPKIGATFPKLAVAAVVGLTAAAVVLS